MTAAADQGALQVMAAGYVQAWLNEDYWTCAQITGALEEAGTPGVVVAEVFSLYAASLLTEALGGSSSKARAAAGRRAAVEAARQGRLLAAAG